MMLGEDVQVVSVTEEDAEDMRRWKTHDLLWGHTLWGQL